MKEDQLAEFNSLYFIPQLTKRKHNSCTNNNLELFFLQIHLMHQANILSHCKRNVISYLIVKGTLVSSH